MGEGGGVAVVVFVGFCLHKVELLSFKTDETLSYLPWESVQWNLINQDPQTKPWHTDVEMKFLNTDAPCQSCSGYKADTQHNCKKHNSIICTNDECY